MKEDIITLISDSKIQTKIRPLQSTENIQQKHLLTVFLGIILTATSKLILGISYQHSSTGKKKTDQTTNSFVNQQVEFHSSKQLPFATLQM